MTKFQIKNLVSGSSGCLQRIYYNFIIRVTRMTTILSILIRNIIIIGEINVWLLFCFI